MDNVLKRTQVKKFGWYGLLKNLKFFEPYLLLYMIFQGLSFTEIGVLYAIRELIVFVFEIPSGVFADTYGKKNELLISITLYILSFVGFFFASSFALFIIPIVLFGLGEAFRSGTHKAMIMEYLDKEEINISKRQVYGFTRSYSNIGSTISSLFGIILILTSPDLNILFVISIIPYIILMFLIISYPKYMNESKECCFKMKVFLKENIESIKYVFKNKKLRNYIIDTSVFQANFKAVKDYVQPLVYTAGITYILFSNNTLDQNLKVYIGLTYAIAQFISVFVARNAYKLRDKLPTDVILYVSWIVFAAFSILVGAFSTSEIVIILALQAFYITQNIRKPFMVQRVGDAAANERRASALSVESQLTSLLVMVLSPVLGYLSDTFGIRNMFLILGIGLIIYSSIQYLFKKNGKKNDLKTKS